MIIHTVDLLYIHVEDLHQDSVNMCSQLHAHRYTQTHTHTRTHTHRGCAQFVIVVFMQVNTISAGD